MSEPDFATPDAPDPASPPEPEGAAPPTDADGPIDKGVSGLDGPISHYVNRPVSGLLSGRLAKLPLTPDHYTYASFASACLGALAFAARRPRVGAVLTHASALLDEMDGEIARLQGTSSAQGALLDVALDRSSDAALLAGLALGAGGRRVDWAMALTATTSILTSSVVTERAGAEGTSVSAMQREEGSRDVTGAALRFVSSDGRLFAVAVLGLLRQPRLALAWLAGASTLRFVHRLRAARTALRRPAEE
jgi:phosphatidylglycerophosphate synthase